MSPTYRFGRFELIPATRQLLADGGAVTLGARAFDVLLALIERRERLVSKDELLKLAWPGLVVEEGNLQVQISALRKILGPQAIATISGKGYRFAMRFEDDPPPAVERPADAPERRKEPRPWLVPSQSEGPRLAAVVFTDVVGYSARMQKDEAGTIGLVKSDFERMRVLCGKHGGESLNTMGDGLLLCFPSALQAVSCALQIQREFGARKQSTPNSLEHRIGVHLGDVFHLDTGDVAGDGINIASRLESKAPPGGICLSQTVYDTVKGKLPMRSTFLGPENFKNIAEPVPIWQVTPEEVGQSAEAAKQTEVATRQASTNATKTPPLPSPARAATRWKHWSAAAAVVVVAVAVSAFWLFSRPQVPTDKSIAVLPFANMSEDKGMAYFADGVQDDLLTQLALLGELKVVSRTSVAEYRKSGKNIRQIATELGVNSLVEGSVRRAGDRVRVSAQLIDARSDKHLWAQTYDRDLKDIFAIQSELATEIAKALKVSLTPAEEKRLARKPTDNLAAYDLYQKYQDLERRSVAISAEENLNERIALLERVVALDPKFALAWARLGTEDARMYFFQLDQTEARRSKARQAVDRALALAPDDLAVKAEVGNFYYYGLRDFARAATYFEDLLRVAPSNVAILAQLSWVKRRLGRWPESNSFLERALAIDPRNLEALRTFRENMEKFRHWDEAIALQRRITELQPADIEEQARLRSLEWDQSGSPAAYIAWRSALPEKVIRESSSIWYRDFQRTLEQGDVDSAIQMLESGRARESSGIALLAKELRALLLIDKGERTPAHALARSALREAEAVLEQRPDDSRSLWKAMLSHAALGERQSALDAYGRLRRTARGDAFGIEALTDLRVLLYASLRDRDRAFRALEFSLKHQASWRSEHLFADLARLLLRGDPRIEALLRDPASNAPLPFVNQDLEKMLAELSA